MSRDLGAHWFVVRTKAHAESKALHHLERQGFKTYLPRYLKRRRHARRLDFVAAPFFPRYLFVAVDVASQRWRTIQSTIGVSCLVCNGENPAIVPDDIIFRIRTQEDERGFVQLNARKAFARGDKIRIVEGIFSDCMGLFEQAADSERIAVLLDLLGRKVRVSLDADVVVAA